MATTDTDLPPTIPNPLDVPRLACGAMAELQPYPAHPAHQEKLGFPGELIENWKEVAIAKIGELAKTNRAFQVYLDICVKCGACTDKCHYFLGTGDPKNMPVARQDLLRSVYRRYYTFAGKYFPWLVGARDLMFSVPSVLGLLPLWH
jgi:NAD-dependent dihydropyrimidine dehydrogenase PreA subunit